MGIAEETGGIERGESPGRIIIYLSRDIEEYAVDEETGHDDQRKRRGKESPIYAYLS